MDNEKKTSVLFEILSSEQQILQRTDQKAFTMLSLLGVFAVFFISHYTKIPPTPFNLIFIFIYFLSVLSSIYFLLLVVIPRFRDEKINPDPGKKKILPTFFAGIIKYKSSEEYARQLEVLLENPKETYEIFAQSIYSVGRINSFKHKYLKYGIFSFVTAIAMEFIIVVSLYVGLLFETL
jgi:hypothetical protein